MLLECAETDWLASKPIFYNEVTGLISDCINEVIDYNNIEIHPEGFNNYLQYGYSVFGQTPIKNVKMLRYSSRIFKDEKGKIHICEFEDPVEKIYGKNIKSSSDVINEIIDSTRNWAESTKGNIILPLSGGYDSKLLAYSVKDYARVGAFSYGYSRKQWESYETVKAKMTAEACNLPWHHIPLGEYENKKYHNKWYDIYGASVHLHGMYQMEFYENILTMFPQYKEGNVLSGIIGDGWAGNVRISSIDKPSDIKKLGYTHGLCIEDNISQLKNSPNLLNEFFEKNREKMKEENWRIIYSMRLKMTLLHYLCTTPQKMGLQTWSPFLQCQTAMNMVNLSWDLKTDRIWQREFFEKEGLNYGWLKTKCDYNTDLNTLAFLNNPLEPLDIKYLQPYIKSDYIDWINNEISRKPWRYLSAKPKTPQNMINKYIKKHNDPIHKAVIKGYVILKPIEWLLKSTYK